MQRPVRALLLAAASGLLGACDEITDESAADGRPLELAYLTQAIFEPSCGQTQCHSTFKQAAGLVFDNPEATRVSLLLDSSGPLLSFTEARYDPLESDGKPNLIQWVTEIDPFEAGTGRMPFDAPLPQHDIDLLEVWIRSPVDVNGVTQRGGLARGAQCNPAQYEGLACNNDQLVTCNDDFNFGELVETCANGCTIRDICDDPVPPVKLADCTVPLRTGAECSK